MRRIASYLTNKSGFSDQFTAAAVGQTILGQPPGEVVSVRKVSRLLEADLKNIFENITIGASLVL